MTTTVPMHTIPTLRSLERMPLSDLRRLYRQLRADLGRLFGQASNADLDARIRQYVCPAGTDDAAQPAPAGWVAAAMDALQEAAGELHESRRLED